MCQNRVSADSQVQGDRGLWEFAVLPCDFPHFGLQAHKQRQWRR